jgi:hypothetical protein
MFNLFELINKYSNKKYKHHLLNKLFKYLKVILFLNYDEDDNKLKILDILKKIIVSIIENSGKIKMDKNLLVLVDKYNNIISKSKSCVDCDHCESENTSINTSFDCISDTSSQFD